MRTLPFGARQRRRHSAQALAQIRLIQTTAEVRRADEDFLLAPPPFRVMAGVAEAVRRSWHRLPLQLRCLSWIGVWWAAQLVGAPGADDIIRQVRQIG